MHKAFEEYQLFTKTTAVYPEKHSQPYLSLGMCDESGELLEKIEWLSTHNQASNRKAILAEAGDVMWYIARFSEHEGICLGYLYDHRVYNGVATLQGAAVELSINVAAVAGRVKKRMRDGEGWTLEQHEAVKLKIIEALKNAVGSIECIARALDKTLVDVMLDNQNKLSDRRERGVIKGDGDNR
jgi:hypothetical protein